MLACVWSANNSLDSIKVNEEEVNVSSASPLPTGISSNRGKDDLQRFLLTDHSLTRVMRLSSPKRAVPSWKKWNTS
jgi:hypothetical protein